MRISPTCVTSPLHRLSRSLVLDDDRFASHLGFESTTACETANDIRGFFFAVRTAVAARTLEFFDSHTIARLIRYT